MNADNSITWAEIIFLLVYVVLVFGVPSVIAWASYSERVLVKAFDLSELWLHKGRVDKFAVIILGTWWIHSCSILLWTLLKTITTTDYVTYMGWAIPIMAKMWAPKNGGANGPKVEG